MDDLAVEAKAILAEIGANARKSFGQNFMVSIPVLEAIREAAGVTAGTRVVEIGPGLGFLTRGLLAAGVPVTAIEKDRLFAAYLRKTYGGQGLRVIEADVLKVRPRKDLSLDGRTTVVGNIPYNITSLILEWLIENRASFSSAVLTVQKEVAERLAARPNTPSWGSLSVFVQLYATVTFVRAVPRHAFAPPPRVDSAVIRLELSEDPLVPVADGARMLELSHRAFQKRRKTVLNALERGDKAELSGVLTEAGIDPCRRPETLTLAEWARLSELLAKTRNG